MRSEADVVVRDRSSNVCVAVRPAPDVYVEYTPAIVDRKRSRPLGRGEPTMMADVSTKRPSAPMDGTAIEPTLVLTFSGRGNGGTQRCRIPREGLLLGRDAVVFDEPFADSRMSSRHAQVRIEAGRVLVQDLDSEIGTRLNGRLLVGERTLEAGDVPPPGGTPPLFAASVPARGLAQPGPV